MLLKVCFCWLSVCLLDGILRNIFFKGGKMIIEKDGQIIVTELRPMSEAPLDGTIFMVFDGPGCGGCTSWDGDAFDAAELPTDFDVYQMVGWIPLPIYKPEQQNIAQTCEKCGASNVRVAVQMCSVDPDSDEVCPGSALWG